MITCREFLRESKHPFAWPGGYPRFAVCGDGGVLCFGCVRWERKRILYSLATQCEDGWDVIGFDVNWEDGSLFCDHCGERIKSAYAEEVV